MRFGREEKQRLHYQALSSESDLQGANALARPSDAEAPVDKIWNAAERLEVIRTITSAGACQVLIHRHMFSPEPPADPEAAEWVVLVTSQPLNAEDRVDTGVVRLTAETHSVKGTKEFHDIQMPMDEAQLLEHINGRHFQFNADQLVRKGDFWIASELRPSLVETGGTVIVHARANRILYRATTKAIAGEQGAGEVLVP